MDEYTPPKSDLEINTTVEVPQEILKKIKNAWLAGLVSVGISTVFITIALLGTEIAGIDAFSFIDVILMAIFAFGIYKRSRTCAVLMFLLFAANKILMAIETGAVSGFPLAIALLWFYAMGIVGTFQYHKYIKLNS